MDYTRGCVSLIKVTNENKADVIWFNLIHYFNVNNSNDLKIKVFSISQVSDDNIKYLLQSLNKKFNEFLLKIKKFNKNLDDEIKIMDIKLYLDNEEVNKNYPTIENVFQAKDKKLKVGDFFYKIYTNLPKVISLKLPKVILYNFEVFPELNILNSNEFPPNCAWYKKINKYDKVNSHLIQDKKNFKNGWYKISESFSYIPKKDDIGCSLKFTYTPTHNEIELLETSSVESRNKIEVTPEYFPFEERHKYTKSSTSKNEIRCISYNILAEMYSNSNLAKDFFYPQCDPKYLAMPYRINLLLKEILNYNADIVCLQEVEEKVFNKDLIQFFERKSNLKGVLALKKYIKEGIACFYNSKKFKFIEDYKIFLCDYLNESSCQDLKEQVLKNDNLFKTFNNRNNVLQGVLLESQDLLGNAILVLNTHLFFKPNADNIRLLQTCIIIRFIESKIKELENNYKKITPIFFGDFNSCPENGIYKLLTTKFIDQNQEDLYSNEEEIIKNFNFSHNLNFVSACGTPVYTNYTVNFNGCLDYIFLDNSVFEIKEVVPHISHEEVDKLKGIPNEAIPSDHLALVCKISWL